MATWALIAILEMARLAYLLQEHYIRLPPGIPEVLCSLVHLCAHRFLFVRMFAVRSCGSVDTIACPYITYHLLPSSFFQCTLGYLSNMNGLVSRDSRTGELTSARRVPPWALPYLSAVEGAFASTIGLLDRHFAALTAFALFLFPSIHRPKMSALEQLLVLVVPLVSERLGLSAGSTHGTDRRRLFLPGVQDSFLAFAFMAVSSLPSSGSAFLPNLPPRLLTPPPVWGIVKTAAWLGMLALYAPALAIFALAPNKPESTKAE